MYCMNVRSCSKLPKVRRAKDSRDRRGEEHGLPAPRAVLEDLEDLVPEAELQQAVGFLGVRILGKGEISGGSNGR